MSAPDDRAALDVVANADPGEVQVDPDDLVAELHDMRTRP
jgi:hypothetical protein